MIRRPPRSTRTDTLFPYTTLFRSTVVAVAVIWRYLFHTRYGLVNWGLSSIGIEPVDWLGDPNWAMPTIILFAGWRHFGYNMILFPAGLQSFPEALSAAARIPCAGPLRRLRTDPPPMPGTSLLLVPPRPISR